MLFCILSCAGGNVLFQFFGFLVRQQIVCNLS
uniref:Uncharacterized protein n=1 Tax=Arundo donax TaxID=35708 RepID=A0A0A9BIQ9_ARUDO